MTHHADQGVSHGVLGVGAVAMVLCCAGSALVAAGVLGAIGRMISSPVIILAALAAATGAIVAVVRRHRGGVTADGCPSARRPQDAGAHRPGTG